MAGNLPITAPRCRWCNCRMPRGSYRNVFKRNRFTYAECSSQLSCFNRVLKQRDAMRRIGTQMYNVFYNISQRTEALHPNDPAVFSDMQLGWEAAKRETGF